MFKEADRMMLRFKKLPIQRDLRFAIIAILVVITCIFAGSSYVAFQEPESVEKSYSICSYSHSGRLSYTVYLKNNSLYDKNVLYPGEGVIFEKITDHINATFSYRFMCEKKLSVQGYYTLVEKICSDLWEKEFVIIPRTSFESDGFEIKFPINYTHFKEFVKKINEETGVLARNPKLIIICKINVFAVGKGITINDFFDPSWNVTINGGIIEISGDPFQSKEGSVKGKKLIHRHEVVGNRNSFLASTFLSLAILLGFYFFTKESGIKWGMEVKQIRKKYGEWIVEVEKVPKKREIINLKSIDDLVKVSEEVGKPVLYKPAASLNEDHVFCVIDSNTRYQFLVRSKPVRK